MKKCSTWYGHNFGELQNTAIFTDQSAKLLLLICYSNETKINGCQDIEIAQSDSFKISAIHFVIKEVSDFQLNYLYLWVILIPIHCSFRSDPESEMAIMCHGLLCLLLCAPEIPNTKFMLQRIILGNFDELKLDLFWHHCTSRELLYVYQTQKVTKWT